MKHHIELNINVSLSCKSCKFQAQKPLQWGSPIGQVGRLRKFSFSPVSCCWAATAWESLKQVNNQLENYTKYIRKVRETNSRLHKIEYNSSKPSFGRVPQCCVRRLVIFILLFVCASRLRLSRWRRSCLSCSLSSYVILLSRSAIPNAAYEQRWQNKTNKQRLFLLFFVNFLLESFRSASWCRRFHCGCSCTAHANEGKALQLYYKWFTRACSVNIYIHMFLFIRMSTGMYFEMLRLAAMRILFAGNTINI